MDMYESLARIMWHHGYTVLPDRPMHPEASMTGGDSPCWGRDGRKTKEFWLNLPSCVGTKGYFSSAETPEVSGVCGR